MAEEYEGETMEPSEGTAGAIRDENITNEEYEKHEEEKHRVW